jgi:hypothetical protein
VANLRLLFILAFLHAEPRLSQFGNPSRHPVRNFLQSVSTFATLLEWGFVPTRHYAGATSFPFFWERVQPFSACCHSLLFEHLVRPDC